MRRNTLIIGTALAATLLVAGCSSTTSGSPSSTTTTADSSTADLAGAPHVANPLDTSKFQKDPCSSITSAQLATLNIGTVAEVRSSDGVPTCGWKTAGNFSQSTAIIGYLVAGAGLSSLYSQRSEYAIFQVLPPVDGYPAVYAADADGRSRGACIVTVGVSDSLAVSIGLTVNSGQYKTDPCTPNQQLAADVISNIKNGG